MLEFTVPVPPSVNQLFANVGGKGRVATKRYTQWRVAAGMVILAQHLSRISGPVALEYAIGPNTRADLGNHEKALTDLLVSANIIDGDDRKTVKSIALWWAEDRDVKVTVRRAA